MLAQPGNSSDSQPYESDMLITLVEIKTAFGPEDTAAMTTAFEEALKRLNVVDREAPMATSVAKKIVRLAKRGPKLRLSQQCASMTNAPVATRSCPRPELRIPNAAAQTRVVSLARIRLDSQKSVRLFKEIICDDISEFESHMPSHAVGSLYAI